MSVSPSPGSPLKQSDSLVVAVPPLFITRTLTSEHRDLSSSPAPSKGSPNSQNVQDRHANEIKEGTISQGEITSGNVISKGTEPERVAPSLELPEDHLKGVPRSADQTIQAVSPKTAPFATSWFSPWSWYSHPMTQGALAHPDDEGSQHVDKESADCSVPAGTSAARESDRTGMGTISGNHAGVEGDESKDLSLGSCASPLEQDLETSKAAKEGTGNQSLNTEPELKETGRQENRACWFGRFRVSGAPPSIISDGTRQPNVQLNVESDPAASKKQNTKSSAPSVPATTAGGVRGVKRTASPVPSSSSPKKIHSPPNLVLPTWEDTFHVPPRSMIPPSSEIKRQGYERSGGNLLGRAMGFVSSVLFSKDNTATGLDSSYKGKLSSDISDEHHAHTNGYEEEQQGKYQDFGKQLPRAWELVGPHQDNLKASRTPPPETLAQVARQAIGRFLTYGQDANRDGTFSPGEQKHINDTLRGCRRVVVIGVHGWFPGAVVRTVLGEGKFCIREKGEVSFGLLVWSTGLAPNPLVSAMSGVKKNPKTQSAITNDQLNVTMQETSEPSGCLG
ncbi:hypothetical protein Agabi119p4_1398 [Agaricus bisporus var. burnettii]|uniref:FAD/NAD(P)-binding domain-containing protein n=1 Tax=Agaricus bisporus var. burnettii TaxID=192524 RepID=A0A8H7FCC7_AGABI|nr:hypothetical protein Agabi119p4_1398 [Agaricus bisporus var. burnettii]